jgi:hypothetical protein
VKARWSDDLYASVLLGEVVLFGWWRLVYVGTEVILRKGSGLVKVVVFERVVHWSKME